MPYSLFLPVGQGPQGRRYFFLTVHATLKSIRVVTALFRRGQTGRSDRADVFQHDAAGRWQSIRAAELASTVTRLTFYRRQVQGTICSNVSKMWRKKTPADSLCGLEF